MVRMFYATCTSGRGVCVCVCVCVCWIVLRTVFLPKGLKSFIDVQ